MMSELFDEQAQREQYEIAREMEVRAEVRAEERAGGRVEGMLKILVGLVRDGILSVVEAAKRADLSVSEFEALTGLRRV